MDTEINEYEFPSSSKKRNQEMSEIQKLWQSEPDDWLLKAATIDINNYPEDIQIIIIEEVKRRGFWDAEFEKPLISKEFEEDLADGLYADEEFLLNSFAQCIMHVTGISFIRFVFKLLFGWMRYEPSQKTEGGDVIYKKKWGTIKLQEKTTALPGTVESYWFENEHIGLKKTLFHRVSIPLEAFNSGLEYEEQPVETTIEFEWFNLGLSDPGNLNDINMSNEIYPEGEASVYVGNAHNWCDVKKLLFTSVGDNKFKVEGELFIKFEIEGVAKNEDFNFETTVTYHQIGHE